MTIVENLIKTEAIFYSTIKYDRNRYGWDFSRFSSRVKCRGVYFIVKNNNGNLDILKIGKADGKDGFHQRFSYYKSSAVNRVDSDRTIFPIHYAMCKVDIKYGENCDLELYILPVEKSVELLYGFEVESSKVRSFEKTLSLHAKKQGHSMLLSGQD